MRQNKKPGESHSQEGLCLTEPCCPCRFAMLGACSSPASHLCLWHPWHSFLCPVGTRHILQFNHWWQVWIATTPVQPLAAMLFVSLEIIPAWNKDKLKQWFCSSVAGDCVHSVRHWLYLEQIPCLSRPVSSRSCMSHCCPRLSLWTRQCCHTSKQ